MSDTNATAALSGGTPKVSKINEAVIRIAGNSQDGIQVIGGFLARLAGRSEQEVMTFMTIPATISGGPSIFQVRMGTGDILSAGDQADVLVVFYQHSYEDHIESLRPGGVLLTPADIDVAKLPTAKALNVSMLGRLSRHFDFPEQSWRDSLRAHFAEKLHAANEKAFALGRGV